MDFSSNRNVTSLRLGKTVMEKEYTGFESNVSCLWRDVEGVCVCCPLSASTSAVIWSVMVLEGEENVVGCALHTTGWCSISHTVCYQSYTCQPCLAGNERWFSCWMLHEQHSRQEKLSKHFKPTEYYGNPVFHITDSIYNLIINSSWQKDPLTHKHW